MARQLRGFGRRSGSSSTRRRTGWSIGPGQVDGAAITFTASAKGLIGAGAASVADGQTVVRIRGEFLAYLTGVTAVNDGYLCALGIGIASEDAFMDIGVTALMDPISDVDWDGWLYHRYFSIHATSTLTGVAAEDLDFANVVAAAVRFEIDTKAMRKIPEGDVLYMILQVVLDGGATLLVHGATRALVMLA